MSCPKCASNGKLTKSTRIQVVTALVSTRPRSVILESLDKTGSEEIVRLATDPEQSDPMLVRVREAVGVVFDKK